MQLGERPVSMILSTAALLLALVIGAIIPLLSGDSASRKVLAWTPPPTVLVSPTVRVISRTPVDPIIALTAVPPAAASQTSPTPTETPIPPPATLPPTVTPAPPTPTSGPPTRTPTTTPQNPAASVLVEPLNLRTGPGTDFPPLGIARIGDVYALRGRTADAGWYQVCCVQGALAWVRAEFVAASGAIDTLPIVP